MRKLVPLLCLAVAPTIVRAVPLVATLGGHTFSMSTPEGWSGGGRPSGDTYTAQYASPTGAGMIVVAGARAPSGPVDLDGALGNLLGKIGPAIHLVTAGASHPGSDANGYPVRVQALSSDDGGNAGVAMAIDGGPIFIVVIIVPQGGAPASITPFAPMGRSFTVDNRRGPWIFSKPAPVQVPSGSGDEGGDEPLPDRLAGAHDLDGAYWCHYRTGRWVWWVFNADGYIDLKRPRGWKLVTAGRTHTNDVLEAYRVRGDRLETQFKGDPIKTHSFSRRSGALVIDGDACRRWDHDYSGTRLEGTYGYSYGGQYSSGYGSIVFGADGTLAMSSIVAATSYAYGQVTGSGYAANRPRAGRYRIEGAEMIVRWDDGQTQTLDFFTDSGTTDPSKGIYVDGTRYKPQR